MKSELGNKIMIDGLSVTLRSKRTKKNKSPEPKWQQFFAKMPKGQ